MPTVLLCQDVDDRRFAGIGASGKAISGSPAGDRVQFGDRCDETGGVEQRQGERRSSGWTSVEYAALRSGRMFHRCLGDARVRRGGRSGRGVSTIKHAMKMSMRRGCATMLAVLAWAVTAPAMAQEKAATKANAARGQQIASQVCTALPHRRRQFDDRRQPQAGPAACPLPVQAIGGLHGARGRTEAGARERHHERHCGRPVGSGSSRRFSLVFQPGRQVRHCTQQGHARTGPAHLARRSSRKNLPACSGCHTQPAPESRTSIRALLVSTPSTPKRH